MVTLFPDRGVLVKGYHEEWTGAQQLVGAVSLEKPKVPQYNVGPDTKTNLFDRQMAALTASIARNRNKIIAGQLTAADYVQNKDNLDHLILVRLHNQLQGALQKWFFLDEMFTSIQMDKLTLRMSFRDNPAAAQKVPRRQQYDVARVAYDEVVFNLEKLVTAYDMPIEDPLRALLSPIEPLEQSNEYAQKYARENDAFEALKKLKYYYDPSKSQNSGEWFTAESAPADTNVARIPNPNTLAAGDVHSKFKTVNEIQKMRTRFMVENDLILTHGACSPKTAMELAQNTWTQPNTIFNVEAYRTAGGVRNFPGISDATMVISAMVDDDVVYWTSKPSAPMVLGEGPKMARSWEDNDTWVSKNATADFYQYKCAHEDLSDITRKFGVIMPISTTDA